MKKTTKLISIILCLAMVISLLPISFITASAETLSESELEQFYIYSEHYLTGEYRVLLNENFKNALSNGNSYEPAGSTYTWEAGSPLPNPTPNGMHNGRVVESMSEMFSGCTYIRTLDFSEWDTSKIKDMSYMFSGCTALTSLDLSAFDTSSVTNMRAMFRDCTALASLDISGFDVDNVTNFASMFSNTSKSVTKKPVISYVNGKTLANTLNNSTTTGINTNYIVFERVVATEEDLAYFYDYEDDTENFTETGKGKKVKMKDDFKNAVNSNSSNPKEYKGGNHTWKTGDPIPNPAPEGKYKDVPVTNLNGVFADCKEVEKLDLSDWDTRNVKSTKEMYKGCDKLQEVDHTGWNTENVKDMGGMFKDCPELTKPHVEHFKTDKVEDMSYMFHGCKKVEELDLKGWNTHKVGHMEHMFHGCEGLKKVDLTGWNTGKVEHMGHMFHGCHGLEKLDLSSFLTHNVKDFSNMFNGCSGLKDLDISNFEIKDGADLTDMFTDAGHSDGWNVLLKDVTIEDLLKDLLKNAVTSFQSSEFIAIDPDSGYYADAFNGENKKGVIAFNAHVENYDGVTLFGFMIYNSGAVGPRFDCDRSTELADNEGQFHALVGDIAEEDFDNNVYAMPFIMKDGKFYWGELATSTVQQKWLGAE